MRGVRGVCSGFVGGVWEECVGGVGGCEGGVRGV